MNIAIFASGSGTNAENIINYFSNSETHNISFVLSNKKDAFVLERANKHGVKSIFLTKSELGDKEFMLTLLKKNNVDLIVLAGYLKLIPEFLVEKYVDKIVNIHPALLPKYGGKGMYGMNVHKAVVENNELETGITVHYVNAKYDDGQIIAQFKCSLTKSDTPDDVAEKIHHLEMDNFPQVIDNILSK